MTRKSLLVILALVLLGGWKVWSDTMSDPVVKRVTVTSSQLPKGTPPVTIALLADIHVAGPDMPPHRLARIAEQTNALGADLIVVAGDLVSEKRTGTKHYAPDEVITPLGKLRARYGTAIVPGNHDHWYGWPELRAEISKFEHLTVLQNEAVQMGPIVLGGMDDDFTGNDDLSATLKAMGELEGLRVMLTHTPDLFPQMPSDIALVLAGHTHCGQIAYPWGGAPVHMSEYGDTYACGVVREDGKTLVTSAGLGTSVLPMRLFTQPELWLIELRAAE